MKKILKKLMAVSLIVQAVVPQLSICSNATDGTVKSKKSDIMTSDREAVNDLDYSYFLHYGRRIDNKQRVIKLKLVDGASGAYTYRVKEKDKDKRKPITEENSWKANRKDLSLVGVRKDNTGSNVYIFESYDFNFDRTKRYVVELKCNSIANVTKLPRIRKIKK